MKVEFACIIGVGQFTVGTHGIRRVDVRGEEEGSARVTVETEEERLVLDVPWGLLVTSERGWHKKEESDEPADS